LSVDPNTAFFVGRFFGSEEALEQFAETVGKGLEQMDAARSRVSKTKLVPALEAFDAGASAMRAMIDAAREMARGYAKGGQVLVETDPEISELVESAR
jgi:phytoene/squalene synthetase